MKRLILGGLISFVGLLSFAGGVVGADTYAGDTAIYGRKIKPNLLIIIDTSGSMGRNLADQDISKGSAELSKMDIAKNVLSDLVASTTGVKIGVMRFDSIKNEGGGFIQGHNGYVTTVKNMDETFTTAGIPNREALQAVISGLEAGGSTPLAETLLEAGRYFQGKTSAFGRSIGTTEISTGNTTQNVYTSPIDSVCQPNYIILVSDGMSTRDDSSRLAEICTGGMVKGDCDGDRNEPAADPTKTYGNGGSDYLDDVAYYLHNNDLSNDYVGTQNVTVYTIGFGLGASNPSAVSLLNEAAENGGSGQAFLASDYTELKEAFQQIVNEVEEVDTSFVAPVVPTSPENRTYSGNRIYFSLFKPIDDGPWLGNLKKFKLGTDLRILDMYDDPAIVNDDFSPNAISYWSTEAEGGVGDGGAVEQGGNGEVLKAQFSAPVTGTFYSSSGRKIFTYLGDATNKALNAENSIDQATPSQLGLATDDTAGKEKIIKYLYGLDAYNNDSAFAGNERSWLQGDILHSKPEVVSYNMFSYDDETKCAPEGGSGSNKSVIYFGGNDGMLHAVRDCDGEELWAFVPPDLLTELQYLGGMTRYPMVDGPITSFVYDANHNGIIETGTDKVVLLFGLRRGGSAYSALDVTDPAAPAFLWRIDAMQVSDIGQTWSQPKLGKVKWDAGSGVVTSVVAFVGAGYDNGNEDQRFGSTQNFTGDAALTPADDKGAVGSAGSVTAGELAAGKGRGVFAFEVARLSASGISLPSGPTVVWKFVKGESTVSATTPGFSEDRLLYSIPSDIKVLDTDYDGYTDRLYVGDTGGQVWRISAHKNTQNEDYIYLPEPDPVIDDWFGQVVFNANPGSDSTNGRKFFNPPSVVYEGEYIGVYLGSGDRAHPLNAEVVDRLYAIYDRGQGTLDAIGEAKLEDVTSDDLQKEDALYSDTCPEGSTAPNCILDRLLATNNYGWYIKLEDTGEKALSAPLVFSKVAYFPTYIPASSTDVCSDTIDLGTARIWAVDYKTGEAVFNFDEGNDSSGSPPENERARGGDGIVLAAPDRYLDIGEGIPPSPVVVIHPGGKAKVMIGTKEVENVFEDPVVPVYWRSF